MPYTPVGIDPYFIPKWNELHSDWHPRWISMDARRRSGHTMTFGDVPGYKEYGAGMTKDELVEKAAALGLSDAYVNSNLNRIVFGDVMLAYIPREEFIRRTKEKMQAVSGKDEAVIESFKEETRRAGMRPVVYGSEEEYKDKRDFATKEGGNRTGYSGANIR